MKTEFEFTLPRGYLEAGGQLHRTGLMRLATAMDEIEALNHPRVQENESYLPIVLFSRVITHLGQLPLVTPQHVEGMFASDLAFLEELYERLNSPARVTLGAICPNCSTQFQIQVAPLEEA